MISKWDKVFKNEPSDICGRQPLKNLKGYGLLKQTISLQIFYRLSFANFTKPILEYFVPNVPLLIFFLENWYESPNFFKVLQNIAKFK